MTDTVVNANDGSGETSYYVGAAFRRDEDFSLTSGGIHAGSAGSINLNNSGRDVRLVDDDGVFNGDDVVSYDSGISDVIQDFTQKIEVDGVLYNAYIECVNVYTDADGNRYEFAVVDVDFNGDGEVRSDVGEEAAFLIQISGPAISGSTDLTNLTHRHADVGFETFQSATNSFGAELIKNGSFENSDYTSTAYTAPEDWDIGGTDNSGGLHYSVNRATDGEQYYAMGGWSQTTGGTLSQSVALEEGKVYALSFDVQGTWGDGERSVLVEVLDANGEVALSHEVVINYGETVTTKLDFVANADDMTLRFTHTGGTASNLDLDNISMRQVINAHNDGPVAVDDAIATTESAEVSGNLLTDGPANLIQNGSFEDSAYDGRAFSAPEGWEIGGTANSGGLHRGTTRASDGDQYYVMGGWSNETGGTLSQDVKLEAGETYTLSFDAGSIIENGNKLLVEVFDEDGNIVLSEEVTVDYYERANASFAFEASDADMTVRFTHTAGASSDIDLDNVSLVKGDHTPAAIEGWIEIENAGFESRVLGENGWTRETEGWESNSSAGVYNAAAGKFDHGEVGENNAWLNRGGEMSQTLETTAEEGQVYTMSLLLGERNDQGSSQYIIRLKAGDAVVAEHSGYTAESNGMNEVTFSGVAGADAAGQPLTIEIVHVAGDQLNVDDIVLIAGDDIEAATAHRGENGAMTDFDANGDDLTIIETSFGAVGEAVEVQTEGGHMGTLTVMADGSYVFKADDSTEGLAAGETDTLTFTYTVASEGLGGELIVNGDFEDHAALTRTTSMGTKWGVFDTIEGWTTPVGNLEIQEGTHGGTAVNGSQNSVVELDSHYSATNNASLQQTVQIGEAGTYRLELDYTPRQKGSLISETSELIVLVNGEAVATLTADALGYVRHSFDLELDAGANDIGFAGGGVDDTYGAMIDNVSMRQVLELTDTATATITVQGEESDLSVTDNAYTTSEGALVDDAQALTGNVITDDTGAGADSSTGAPLSVTAVSTGAVGEAVEVTSAMGHTGALTVNADGSFSFQGGEGFRELNEGETDTVVFEYTASNGELGDELIENGTFEQYGSLRHGNWGVFDAIPGWTTPIGALEIQEGPNHNGVPVILASNAIVELDSHYSTSNNASLEQTVSIEKDGMFRLAFDYSPRQKGSLIAETSELILLVDGEEYARITADELGYVTHEFMLDLGAGDHVIGFAGGGVDDTYGALIDNVSLRQTAETATVTIEIDGEGVANLAPVAVENDYAITEDAVAAGNVMTDDTGAGADFDPEGDALTVTDARVETIVSAEGLEGELTLNADGSFTITLADEANAMGASDTDTFTFAYTISDGEFSSSAEVTVSVQGLNDAPVAVANDYAITEDDMAMGNVLTDDTGEGVDSDPEGDSLTVIDARREELTSAEGLKGSLVLSEDGTFSITLDAAAQAMGASDTDTFTFSYTVSDGELESTAEVTVSVQGLNDAPEAIRNDYAITEDDVAGGNLLLDDTGDGADFDVEGDALTVADARREELTSDNGLKGSLVIAEDGAFSITLDETAQAMGASDTDSFTFAYTITDGELTSTANVTVAVQGVNDAPVAVRNDYTILESENLAGNVIFDDTGAGRDYDPEGDTISVDGSVTKTLFSAENGYKAYLNLAENGAFSLVLCDCNEELADGETDTYTFDYTITDGELTDTETVTVTVQGVNLPPEANDDLWTMLESEVPTEAAGQRLGNAVTGALANDVDPEGDALTITSVNGDAAGVGVWVDATGGGQIRLFDNGAVEFRDLDGDFANLEEGQTGVAEVSYTVTDGQFSDQAVVRVNVTGETAADPTPGVDANILWMVDTSDSMQVNVTGLLAGTRIKVAEKKIGAMIDEIKDGYAGTDGVVRLGVVSFGDDALTETFELDFGAADIDAQLAAAKDALMDVELKSGATNFENAFNAASDWFGQAQGTNEFVFMMTDGAATDGTDLNGLTELETEIDAADNGGIEVATIAGATLLQSLGLPVNASTNIALMDQIDSNDSEHVFGYNTVDFGFFKIPGLDEAFGTADLV